jgi:hypothetical protein
VTNAMPRPKRRSFRAHHGDVGVTAAYVAKWLSSLPDLELAYHDPLAIHEAILPASRGGPIAHPSCRPGHMAELSLEAGYTIAAGNVSPHMVSVAEQRLSRLGGQSIALWCNSSRLSTLSVVKRPRAFPPVNEAVVVRFSRDTG